MRGVATSICGLIAMISVTVGVPLMWIEKNLVNKEGFATLAGPLWQDHNFKSVLNTAMAREATSDIAVSPVLAPLVEQAVVAAAQSLENDPGFPQAWHDTLVRSHELTFITPYANATDSEVFNLDVTPLLQLIREKVGQAVGQSVTIPNQVILPFGSKEHRKELAELGDTVGWGLWLVVFGALGMILCIALSRKRTFALVLLGVGTVVIGGLWKMYLEVLNRDVGAGLKGNALGDLFAEQLVVLITHHFSQWISVAFVSGASAIAAGSVLYALRKKRIRRAGSTAVSLKIAP